MSATTRDTYAEQRTNAALTEYDADLAAARLSGLPYAEVAYFWRLATEQVGAELVRMERFAAGEAS